MVKICTETYPVPSEYDEHFAKFDFPLSDFQKYAIEAIATGNHTLVTAHTGSGKTLPAEFAIRHFVDAGKKVIYTSPIKALSNQKYYEFTHKYPEISFGLLTGDIKTNPAAQVLIMTTEILMNRLYIDTTAAIPAASLINFDCDIQTELGCVIFDEVHYINDADRGHVWEQTILMLPQHVQMVMLSATIDRPAKFAEWCESRDTSKCVYLASTDKRIVPLTHYMFWTTTEDPFKKIKDKMIQQKLRDVSNRMLTIQTADGKFVDSAYHSISGVSHILNRERIYMKRKYVMNRLCETMRDSDMLPAIVFVFSRKQVESCAADVTTNILEFDSKVPYIMRRECDAIVRKFSNAAEYLELPEYNALVKLLEKGVAIHHSGMMPVLREIVEIMISRKYVKLLFATESFAIGLDCPIRSAVFTNLSKHTNGGLRTLYSHEYTQMAGRAGRRGIDVVGNVIHLNNLFDLPDIAEYRELLGGKPQKLVSKFHISYSTILSLIGHGQNTVGMMCDYVCRSMMGRDISAEIAQVDTAISEKRREYAVMCERLGATKTPESVCMSYNSAMDMLSVSMLAQKKRKDLERQVESMVTQNASLKTDAALYRVAAEMNAELGKEEVYANHLESRIRYQTNAVCSILQEYGLVSDEGGEYRLTETGNAAVQMSEIHPMCVSHLFSRDLSVTDYAAIFACLVGVRDVEECTIDRAEMADTPKSVLREMVYTIDDVMAEETEMQIETGISYDEVFGYSIVPIVLKWIECATAEECKRVIQTELQTSSVEIGLGDFTKAILKVATIAREMCAVCEIRGDLGRMQQMIELQKLLLKYVATSQSLYV
jgi:superfamily II RNA helicase